MRLTDGDPPGEDDRRKDQKHGIAIDRVQEDSGATNTTAGRWIARPFPYATP